MPQPRSGSRKNGSQQLDLFPRSKRPTIPLADDHPLVVLTDTVDWTEREARAQRMRSKKLKNAAGRPPHLRATIGALVLMAIRYRPYRDMHDLIRYYAPARYLCGLTETDWTPDFRTVHDFARLLGEDGVKLINEGVVTQATKLGFADVRVAVADLTAQEAAIPHPNEMGLMGGFLRSIGKAAEKTGRVFKDYLNKMAGTLKAAKEKVREYRLFAKTKEVKDRVLLEMAKLVEGLNGQLGQALEQGHTAGHKLSRHAIVAQQTLCRLQRTMADLLPQIRHWLRTGRVAAGKIINLRIPELYSIVRGKVGKAVEFGVSWGITRLRGGFVLATMARDREDLHDSNFAVRAVEELAALFGKAPLSYAYDRAGHSATNVSRLRKLGVRDIGLAPRGQTAWAVKGDVKKELIRERSLVEGSIGTIKMQRYGFNRPAAQSVAMMGVCGQRAVLGFNLGKLVRCVAQKRRLSVVW
jgi:hypothetical protein